jgi:hypothetical protein
VALKAKPGGGKGQHAAELTAAEDSDSCVSPRHVA